VGQSEEAPTPEEKDVRERIGRQVEVVGKDRRAESADGAA
jgi:hypothetical protein